MWSGGRDDDRVEAGVGDDDDDDDDDDAGDAWDGIEYEYECEYEWWFTGGVDDARGGGWTRGARRGVGDANEENGRSARKRTSGRVAAVCFVVGDAGARD